MSTAAQHWTQRLGQWGIPTSILDAAPQSPWIHPVTSFRPDGDLYVDTPSRHRALDALPIGGSVLDVGCGGGRAALGLTPPASRVLGVDHQQQMLDVFAAEATKRNVDVVTVLGDWPTVADMTPECDVVTCHHVLFNVADLEPFAAALDAKARRRAIVEIPHHHPLSSLSEAWLHFWGLVRPSSPTADDALEVLRSMGLDAHLEEFMTPGPTWRHAVTDLEVELTRIRLCLTADRDHEVRTFLDAQPSRERRLATLWWDT